MLLAIYDTLRRIDWWIAGIGICLIGWQALSIYAVIILVKGAGL